MSSGLSYLLAASSIVAVASMLVLSGCAGHLDEAIFTLNAAADAGEAAVDSIEQSYGAELALIADDASMSSEQKQAAITETRAKYLPLFRAYRSFRSGWLVASAAIKRAKDAGASGSEPDLANVSGALVQALALVRSLEDALRKLDASHTGAP